MQPPGATSTTLRPTAAASAPPSGRLPALTLLSHPDVRRVGERVLLPELLTHGEVALSRLQPLFAAPGEAQGRPLEDPFLSRRPVWLHAAPGGRLVLSRAESPMALRLDEAPVEAERTVDEEALAQGVVLELAGRVVLLLHLLPAAAPLRPELGLVGRSPALEAVRDAILRVADLPVPVLVEGETGTGKELVARALHQAGPRAARPYVAVNMAAVPPSTAASELFGHARGAFTGAEREHTGHIARADGGTLFLDEVGDTPADVQTLLLRVLETQELQPLGSARASRVDVRLVAATDVDLAGAMAAGDFRQALFHRLAGYRIPLPPLRERREDVGRLLVHFLRQELQATGELHRLEVRPGVPEPLLPTALVARLARHPWPGNVRELRNVVRQLAISSRHAPHLVVDDALARQLQLEPLPAPPAPGEAAAPPTHAPPPAPPAATPAPPAPLAEPGPASPTLRDAQREAERAAVLDALQRAGQNRTEAARLLGISRRALYNKLERLGLF